MKIAVGCDHGALALKNRVVEHLQNKGYEVTDVGTYTLDSCDYPDYAAKAARLVASGECERGIVMCTTGIGVSIAANKVDGVRCALLSDLMSARLTHDGAGRCGGGRGTGAGNRGYLAEHGVFPRGASPAPD